MNTKKIIHFLSLLLMQFLSLPVFAETTECIEITSVPTVITKQGVYCFKKDLSTNITSGNAIDIQTNNVTIDFNNFKLGGLAAGVGTEARGVYAVDRLNITLRSGNIRGFYYGINLEGFSGGGHVIEDTLLDGNTFMGIRINGEGNLVRSNRVVATGGTTRSDSFSNGIFSRGLGVRILGNEVYGTFSSDDWAHGIYIDNTGDGSIIQGNHVIETDGFASSFGIKNWGSDVIMDGNIIINASGGDYGIYSGTGNYCRENTIVGFTIQNNGNYCTDGGGNSFSP